MAISNECRRKVLKNMPDCHHQEEGEEGDLHISGKCILNP
jgi:hypothetical protein